MSAIERLPKPLQELHSVGDELKDRIVELVAGWPLGGDGAASICTNFLTPSAGT